MEVRNMPVFMTVGYALGDKYPYVGAELKLVSAVDGVGGLAAVDSELRTAAEVAMAKRQAGALQLTNVMQQEVSREKLEELLRHARTREEIIAEQVAASQV